MKKCDALATKTLKKYIYVYITINCISNVSKIKLITLAPVFVTFSVQLLYFHFSKVKNCLFDRSHWCHKSTQRLVFTRNVVK